MPLSPFGWAIGFLALGTISFCTIFGLWIIYRSRKLNAKLLAYMGLVIILSGFIFMGVTCDFITVLITGRNMENKHGEFNIISFFWAAPMAIISLYIFTELVVSEKKRKPILIIFSVSAVIYSLLIFLDPINSFNTNLPGKPGEVLLQSNIVIGSPLSYFTLFGILVCIMCALGYFRVSIKSKGIIRKKYFYLSLGYLLWITAAILESFFVSGVFIIFVRIMFTSSTVLWYSGLREEPEKKEKSTLKKEVKVEGDLFRITKRPEQITEEEVSISKEKKICLVCKGKVLGHNVFICPECETFYCKKCSDALSNLENACWVCNSPIDKSKPVKPFKKEEDLGIEISEMPQKKPKSKK